MSKDTKKTVIIACIVQGSLLFVKFFLLEDLEWRVVLSPTIFMVATIVFVFLTVVAMAFYNGFIDHLKRKN